jgi:hypothetical protein
MRQSSLPLSSIPRDEPFGWLTHMHVLPATNPRDTQDALLSLAAGVALLGICAVGAAIPAAAVYLVTGSPDIARLLLLPTIFGIVMTVVLTSVHWMRIDARGIRLGRRAGRRFIPWSEITGIRPATRREVIVDGWLWPPVPPREATRCMSSLGHFRIDHRRGHFYFPPSDEAQFLGAVEYWRSRHGD